MYILTLKEKLINIGLQIKIIMFNQLKSVVWGLKNSDKILSTAYTVRNCSKCSIVDFSDKNSFCTDHQEQYNKLLNNGPYGQSTREILFNDF